MAEPDAFRQALVSVLSDLRGSRSWNDLAADLDVTRSTISHLINGGRLPSLKLLMQFEDISPGIVEEIFREYTRISREIGAGESKAPRTRASQEQRSKEQD